MSLPKSRRKKGRIFLSKPPVKKQQNRKEKRQGEKVQDIKLAVEILGENNVFPAGKCPERILLEKNNIVSMGQDIIPERFDLKGRLSACSKDNLFLFQIPSGITLHDMVSNYPQFFHDADSGIWEIIADTQLDEIDNQPWAWFMLSSTPTTEDAGLKAELLEIVYAHITYMVNCGKSLFPPFSVIKAHAYYEEDEEMDDIPEDVEAEEGENSIPVIVKFFGNRISIFRSESEFADEAKEVLGKYL